MEIARMGGPGECSDGLLDPDDEHPGFILSDIRGRGRHMENKHVVERSRDKKGRQTPLSLLDKQLHHFPLFFYLHCGFPFICLAVWCDGIIYLSLEAEEIVSVISLITPPPD